MKTTEKIKIALVFAISMMFATNSNAQETQPAKNYDQGFRLGIGLNAGYAAHDPYKLALGADARLQYDLSKRYSVTLTTGFTNLFVSKVDGSDLGFIPAKAGFKAFVWCEVNGTAILSAVFHTSEASYCFLNLIF